MIPIFGRLLGYTAAYGQQELRLLQLRGVEKGAQWGAKLLTQLVQLFLLVCGLGFGSIAAAFLLGQWLGSYAAGFGLVAISFVCLLILVRIFPTSLFRRPIEARLMRSIGRQRKQAGKASEVDLKLEGARLQLTANYARHQIDQNIDALLNEINQSMDPEKILDELEQSIRQRVALAKEQLHLEGTNNLVTLAHLIEAVGQLRKTES